MKPIKINVSSHNLTRCASCARHHVIDPSLSSAQLFLLDCDFCGGPLVGDQTKPSAQLQTKTIGGRSAKLTMGLLGAGGLLSAGLLLTGCEDDEVVERSGGATAGEVAAGMSAAGRSVAGVEIAGTDEAGLLQPYGNPPPAGNWGGIEIAGVEEAGSQDVYGAPPAGDDLPAGETAGVEEAGVEEAGTEEAGTEEAGTETAGTEEAGVEIAGTETAGTDEAGIQAVYGAPPAGEEGG